MVNVWGEKKNKQSFFKNNCKITVILHEHYCFSWHNEMLQGEITLVSQYKEGLSFQQFYCMVAAIKRTIARSVTD